MGASHGRPAPPKDGPTGNIATRYRHGRRRRFRGRRRRTTTTTPAAVAMLTTSTTTSTTTTAASAIPWRRGLQPASSMARPLVDDPGAAAAGTTIQSDAGLVHAPCH